MKILRFFTLILFAIHFGINPAAARRFDQIIAYVNEDVISKWELDSVVNQKAAELQQIYRFSEREAMQKAKQEQTALLDQLIRQMLLVETALTLKIEITEAEVEQYMQNFKDQYKIDTEAELAQALKKEGYTLMSFREQAKRNMMAERLVMQRILPRLQIRDSDVERFFEENRSQLPTKTDRVHLRHIFVAFKPSEADRKLALDKMDTILQDLRVGKDFEELAQRYADDEDRRAGIGQLNQLSIAEMDNLSTTFRDTLAKLNAGETSEPVEGNDGVYLFKVERKDDQVVAFRHLVVNLKPSEAAMEAAYERADSLLQRLNQGEDFNVLAQEYSDDLQTKANSGDLGIRSLSELNPDTRKVIEALSIGAHSTPVTTTFGVHIFKIDNRTAPELSDAEKDQIRMMLRQQKFQEEWEIYTDLLKENAFIRIKSELLDDSED